MVKEHIAPLAPALSPFIHIRIAGTPSLPFIRSRMNQLSIIFHSVRLGALIVAGTTALCASAQDAGEVAKKPDLSIGFEGGTTGFGPVLQYTASERFNFALSYGYFHFDASNLKTDRARYDTKLRMSNLAATVDWHPWRSGFHFTGGAVAYDHNYSVTARARRDHVYEVGNHDYTVAEITSITGRVDTGSQVAPYVGIGWTWSFPRSGLSLITNFGVMFTQDYDAHLTAIGPLANDPVFLQDLRKEEKELNDGLDLYPVAKVGLVYHF